MERYNSLKFSLVTVLLLLVLSSAGCVRTGIRVVPRANQRVLTLNPKNITEIMRMAGFTDSQIADLGTQVWEGLARSGAVQVEIRGRVEVIFAVTNKTEVSLTSMSRGYHVYNTQTEEWDSNNKEQPPSKPQNEESTDIKQEPDPVEQDSAITEN